MATCIVFRIREGHLRPGSAAIILEFGRPAAAHAPPQTTAPPQIDKHPLHGSPHLEQRNMSIRTPLFDLEDENIFFKIGHAVLNLVLVHDGDPIPYSSTAIIQSLEILLLSYYSITYNPGYSTIH
jgi:hypothetical protein